MAPIQTAVVDELGVSYPWTTLMYDLPRKLLETYVLVSIWVDDTRYEFPH